MRTGPGSRAAVRLVNDAILRLDQNTTAVLNDVSADQRQRTFLELLRGALQSFSRRPRSLEINAPYLTAAVEGTEFVLRAEAVQTTLSVFEGVVRAANAYGELAVLGGQSVVASEGRPPRPYIWVQSPNSVQWALYYPPVLAAKGGYRGQALDDAGQGDLYRAAQLLSFGRVDQANGLIDRALARNERSGLAYALRAIIALVLNDKPAALAAAQRSIELEPRVPAPRIALSYVQQATFDLDAARDTLLEATSLQPADPLVWARLAEVWLMLGHRDRSREAAERALALAPELERTHLVLGFAALTEFDTKRARAAFSRAIELDSSDPLPRFGLGLAIIRDGNLKEGRAHLEMAVGLDSRNSLLRSYLGKAYFEERRDPLDAQQLDIATRLDPLDPTPYLYSALRKQSVNRPVDALQDVLSSIELNDKRAVYRSREALDQDRAARGASLGRIYEDLGFAPLGINEASKSLALDPGNSAAHRFLSDIVFGERRREIARVSELFQAQMLQDLNINPVQPSLGEVNLGIATRGGPAKPGFNEFTPLFEANDFQFIASGIVGNRNTYGAEGVASVIRDNVSASAGEFHYETDGWRFNNDIRHDIQTAFVQTAITPELNVQAEFRHRESEQGDLAFNFDPNSFNPFFKKSATDDTARVGARYAISPSADVLLSYIHSDRDETQEFFPGFGVTIQTQTDQVEAQYLRRGETWNVTAGGWHTSQDERVEDFAGASEAETTHLHGYFYSNIKFPTPVTWTFGLAADDFQREPIKITEVSPKLGVRWDIADGFALRAAAFRWIKPALSANRTLEPTQVAGFSQVFDDTNGDDSWRYGVGLDWQATKQIFAGVEGTWRDIDVPVLTGALGGPATASESRREALHRAYLFWTPTDDLSVSAQFVYDRFEADPGLLTSFSNTPLLLETLSIPLGIRYFAPNGFFAGLTVTYVDQHVVRSDDAKFFLGHSDGDETFSVVDLSVGWRLPNRIGLASLSINNLLDEDFRYQDDSFREFRLDPTTGPYTPGMAILGRLTLDLSALAD
ncbi:MAG: TonB-dependent receptor domain-containing protein [Hyphomicrobium sp.]